MGSQDVPKVQSNLTRPLCRNFADVLEVHESVAETYHRMVCQLRERPTNLALNDQQMLAARSAGCALAALEQHAVERDVRLADRACDVVAKAVFGMMIWAIA